MLPDPAQPGAWIVRMGTTDQSHVDPENPTHLEFDYMQRIAVHLDHHAPVGERYRVIHLGGAGLTLARYVAHTRPTSPQIVCEPDAALTELVRAPCRSAGMCGCGSARSTDGPGWAACATATPGWDCR